MTITRRQRDCLTAVSEITKADGFPPSLNDIACHMGIASRSTAQRHVRNLAEGGYLHRGEGHRAVKLTAKGRAALKAGI